MRAALLLTAAGASATAPPKTLVPLDKLLDGQVLDYNTLSLLSNFSVSFLGSFPLQMLNTSVRGLHVDSVAVTQEPGEQSMSVGITAEGAGFDLRTTYSFANAYDPDAPPTVGALNLSAPHNDARISAKIRLTGAAPFSRAVPSNATLESCNISLGRFNVSSDGGLDYLFSHDNMVSEVTLACSQILPDLIAKLVHNASDILTNSTHPVDPTAGVAAAEAAVAAMPGADQLFRFPEHASTAAVESVVAVLSPPGASNATGLNALLDKPGVWAAVAKRLGLGASFPRALAARPNLGLLSKGGVNLTLTELNVTGLDNITAVRFNGHAGNYSAVIGADLGHLRIDVAIEAAMRNPVNGFAVTNRVVVGADVWGAGLNVTVLAAVNATKFGEMAPGMLLESLAQYEEGSPITYLLLCALYPVQALDITTLALGLGGLPPPLEYGILPSSPGGVPSEIDDAIAAALRGALGAYGGGLFAALPQLTQEHLLPVLLKSPYWQQFMASIQTHSGSDPLPLKWACPAASDYHAPQLVDLSNSSAVSAAAWAANDLLAPPSPADANALLRGVLSGLAPKGVSKDGSRVTWPGALWNYSLALPGAQPGHKSLGVAAVYLSDAVLTGFDKIAKLDVLKARGPKEPQTVDNAVSVAGPLRVNATVRVTLTGDCAPTPIDDVLRVSVGVEGLQAAAAVLLRLNASAFYGLPMGRLTDPACLLSALAGPSGYVRIAEDSMRASMSALLADVTCEACSSPGMDALHAALTAPEHVRTLTHYANVVLGKGVELAPQALGLLGVTGDAVDQWIARQAATCGSDAPPGPTPSPTGSHIAKDGSDGPLTIPIVYAMLFGLSGVVFVVLMTMAAYGEWRDSRAASEENRPLADGTGRSDAVDPKSFNTDTNPKSSGAGSRLLPDEGASTFMAARYERATHLSLARHPAVPPVVRVLQPLLLLATAGIFLSSNLGIGAQINAKVMVAGSEIEIEDVFEYGLGNTIRDFWNGKIYPLAVLVGLLSGAWPYIKVSLLLYAWFAPPSQLAHARRGVLLRALDIAGKWSLIDEFLIIMMINAFHIKLWNPPQWDFLPPGFVQIEATVDPKYGIHSFLLGAIMSLTLNHIQVVLHRNAQEADEGRTQGWFAVGADDERRTVLASVAGRRKGAAVTGLLIVTGCLLFAGIVIDTFAFHFKGIAQVALDYEDSADKSYSVYTLAKGMVEQGGPSARSWVAYGWLMGAFMLFAAVVPVLQVVFLLVLWLAPLQLRNQKRLLFSNEVLAAWSSIEVLVLCLFAALIQISRLATFILGSRVDGINALLKDYAVPLGLLTHEQATVFDVHASLLSGFWVLFVASVLSNVAYYITIRFSEHAISAREEDIAAEEESAAEAAANAAVQEAAGGVLAKNPVP